MKLKKVLWGLFFLLAGTGIIINQLGCFGTINIFTLLFTILLIPIIITSIVKLHWGGIFVPLAIIGIMYAKELGITELTPWPLLITAVLVSIGFTILFHKKRNIFNKTWNSSDDDFDTIINEEDKNIVSLHVNFGSSIKYVNSDNFKKGIFNCTFGGMKVYFDNAKVSNDGAEININASFSGVELYIPREWKVINHISASLGGVEEKNKSRSTDGPTVILKGDIKFSGVEIIYI